MRTIFQTHRREFDQLSRMMTEDQRHAVYNRGILLDLLDDSGVDAKRLQQYRRLMKKLHVGSIRRHSTGCTFTVWAGGALPDDGRYLGYEYFTLGRGPAPEELVQSFRMYGPDVPRGHQYIPLEPQWFLYFME
ncbi:MAG: hypothetical protein ACO1QR_07090 [Chthoniobacteraceae bacterium]